MKKISILTSGLVLSLALAACSVGPDYKKPDAPAPAAYKELGTWNEAAPAKVTDGKWWAVYQDDVLNVLEDQVSVSNQSLKADEAAYRQALAAVDEARASFFPVATADAGIGRAKNGNGSAANNVSVSAGASWEIDIWGRIRREVDSEKALAEASASDLAAAKLSLQGALAVDYIELRTAEQLKKLLDDTAVADGRSLQIAQNQYKVGVVSKADVAQAQAQVDSVQAQSINTGIQRAQLEHAIAVLIGKAPSDFSIASTGVLPELPQIPPGVPSTLLQRRPDIAAAERRAAAANEEIGIAMTAYYPDLTLSASYGFAGDTLGNLIRASNNVWSVGPQLAETLFDGGARNAEVRSARAAYDQQVALYRQTVLTGFQQVEDELAALRILEQQAAVQQKAVDAAQEALSIITNQYKAGTVDFTSVVTAETTELGNQQSALSIRQNRLTASITLIEALGGEWDSAQSPAVKSAPAATPLPPKETAPAPAAVAPAPLAAEPAPAAPAAPATTPATAPAQMSMPVPESSTAPMLIAPRPVDAPVISRPVN